MAYKRKSPMPIIEGGTNASTMSVTDGTIYYDGTSLVTTATGTSGQVLTSAGAGVAPAYASPAASSISLTGDSGGALTGNAFTLTGGATGLTFAGAGSTETLGGTVAVAHGGTNATSFATTDGTVIFDGTRLVTLASTGTTGQALVSAGAGVAPAYGTLPVAGGGTNATSFSVTDGTVYFDGTRLVTTATGTSGQVLTSGGAGVAPAYATLGGASISITGDTGGTITSGSFTFAGGTTGLSFGGSGTTETLTFAGITANGGTVSLATDATTSTINVGTGAGVKTSTFGSTNSTSATTVQSGSGALNITATGGALTINSGVGALGISTDASATTVNLGTGAAAKTVVLGSTNTTSTTTLNAGSGGVKLQAVAEGALVTSATSVISTVTGTAGFVLTANAAGTSPSFQAIPSSAMTYTDVTGATQALAVNNGYIMNRATLITATLPATAAEGSIIDIVGKGAGGWLIAQNSGQTIHFGNINTTTGATGSLASSAQYDCIMLICTTANTDFVVKSSIGNITYV